MYMHVICLFNEITKVLIVHALYMYVTCLFDEITKIMIVHALYMYVTCEITIMIVHVL